MNTEDIIMELLVQTFHTLAAEINSPDPNFLYSATGESMLLSFLVLKTWALLVSQSEARLAPDPTLASSKPTFWMSVWPAIFRLLERVDPKKLAVVCVLEDAIVYSIGFIYSCYPILLGWQHWITHLEPVSFIVATSFRLSKWHC